MHWHLSIYFSGSHQDYFLLQGYPNNVKDKIYKLYILYMIYYIVNIKHWSINWFSQDGGLEPWASTQLYDIVSVFSSINCNTYFKTKIILIKSWQASIGYFQICSYFFDQKVLMVLSQKFLTKLKKNYLAPFVEYSGKRWSPYESVQDFLRISSFY